MERPKEYDRIERANNRSRKRMEVRDDRQQIYHLKPIKGSGNNKNHYDVSESFIPKFSINESSIPKFCSG